MTTQNANNNSINVYYGTGRDGAIVRSVDGTESELVNATTYVINPGITMTPGSNNLIAVFATESITVDGRFSASGLSSVSPGLGYQGAANVGGNGAAAPQTNYTDALRLLMAYYNLGYTTVDTLLGTKGGEGTFGTGTTASPGGGGGGAHLQGGTGGNGGADGGGSGVPGTAGLGGGCIILCAPTVTIFRTQSNGDSGLNGTENSGAGGGGSGGTIIAICERYTVTGDLIVNGGDGGNSSSGTIDGGIGGNAFSVGSAPSGPPATGGGAGAGGSGGIIVVKLPRTMQ